jgi:hypothetical protein
MGPLSRFHPIYASNSTHEVTTYRECDEISSNTAHRRMHGLWPPTWSSGSACGRPIHTLDCPSHSSDSGWPQLAYKSRTVARRAHNHGRGRVAGSSPALRSTPATAAGCSPLAPLHGTIPRWPSQRSHARSKGVAQVSPNSSRRQRYLSTTYVNRSTRVVNKHATIAGACRQSH